MWFFQSTVNSGTGFIGSYGGKAYFVTARHIFDSSLRSGDATTITLQIGGDPIPATGKVYFHDNSNIDIAVMKFNDTIPSETERMPLGDRITIAAGQRMIFLGFPLGFSTFIENRAVALVKQAIFSGVIDYHNHKVVLLDGHNNPGFSGGPVLAKGIDGKLHVFSVISGYFHDPIQATTNIQGQVITIPVNANSGIIITTPIERALEIIQKIQ